MNGKQDNDVIIVRAMVRRKAICREAFWTNQSSALRVYTRPDHTCSRNPDKINYGIQVPDFFCDVLVAAAFDIWVRFFTQRSAESVLVAPGNGQKLLFHIIDEFALF